MTETHQFKVVSMDDNGMTDMYIPAVLKGRFTEPLVKVCTEVIEKGEALTNCSCCRRRLVVVPSDKPVSERARAYLQGTYQIKRVE